LKCPKEHTFLLAILAEKGIDLELNKELYYNMMLTYGSLRKDEAVEDLRKNLMKMLFPDIKSNDENLMEKAKQLIPDSGEKFRVRADVGHVIKDENPLARFKK